LVSKVWSISLRVVCYCAPGMRIVPIGVDRKGNINISELKAKAEEHKDK
jgi:hypothetical protein